jgi:alkanesulfonate monooxygenase SsuD/methylene tetrahydromethanopterin reductase-like flavin-dependent oxidoreductase (luciferase family)
VERPAALLGADPAVLNPVWAAEELATTDTMSGSRLVAGMRRSTPNEYVTYNVNPAEPRGRFGEALHPIGRAWSR